MTREMDYHEKQLSQLKLGRKTVAQTTVEEQQRCRTLTVIYNFQARVPLERNSCA